MRSDHQRRSTGSGPGSNVRGDAYHTDDRTSQSTEAPLERICTLPEQIANRELTTNQDRIRFIARDYAEKAPAGLIIDGQTITKGLTAAEGTKPPTQTVTMNFLEKLGKEDIEQTKCRGKKLALKRTEQF